MRFYQIQTMPNDNDEGGASECFWFTNYAEAKRERTRLEEEGVECFDTSAYDIPTTKAALLQWLNNYGNPNGMGSN